MKVCAAVSGACVLITFLTFRKEKVDIMERRKEQYVDNMKFVVEQKRRAAAKEERSGEKL